MVQCAEANMWISNEADLDWVTEAETESGEDMAGEPIEEGDENNAET